MKTINCYKTIDNLTNYKEADHKIHTRTAAMPLFRTAKGEIAKQAAVNGHDERAYAAVDSRRLFRFAADNMFRPLSFSNAPPFIVDEKL